MNIPVSEWIRSSFSGRHNDFASVCDYYFDGDDEDDDSDKADGKLTSQEGTAIPKQFRRNMVGCFVLCGSWNGEIIRQEESILRLFECLLGQNQRTDTSYQTAIIQVDATEGGMDMCCGDGDENDNRRNPTATTPTTNTTTPKRHRLPCPPEQLPAMLLIIKRSSMKEPEIRYLTRLSAGQILSVWRTGTRDAIPDAAVLEMDQALRSFGLGGQREEEGKIGGGATVRSFRQPLRVFVAGDRMSVGKTSVCLGLLGNLVAMGYPPNRLGYIKPATQSESPQLVQLYCEKMGIACVPVGPIVYYRGFTRAFLAGETESSAELLAKVEDAVDALSREKDVVIVDGVGFPAVGSICGTDNASVALASSYPDSYSHGKMKRKALGVLLVGGPGVGSAVDAFNLNATYFDNAQVPVLGAIFNKLSLDGFYSLENCKNQISMYFEQNGPQQQYRRPFGFVPVFPKLGGTDAIKHIHDFIRVFGENVDMDALLDAAYKIQQQPTDGSTGGQNPGFVGPPAKRRKTNSTSARTREEIENLAIDAGAAPSA